MALMHTTALSPSMPEPFVSADAAARFLAITRRYLLELARRGIAGAYPLGTGTTRKIWVFRLSELAACVIRKDTATPDPKTHKTVYDPKRQSPR